MKTKPRLQYAALPFRLLDDGSPEVMLLTSRENRRWIIPKGWPKKGLSGHAVAVREAREEGGLVGRIGKRTVGSYHYAKQLSAEEAVLCRVRIFPLEVKRQLDDWPEKGERDTCWLSPGEAAHLVDDPGLRKVLQGTAKLLRGYRNRRR